ncbi:phage tail assembly protein [Pantoea sp. BAV 3049]|uniref:phage tail assembly protein n=1 Tax=Pantoea sp. BAV 3049 TaxID=2654188 RepID=UPI001E36F7DF|nr:phage tail assembly protein [Pantoea sp. BAV 3049]
MTGNTKTISGTLEIGVEHEGKLHQDFTLRLPTVGDEIDVAEDESVPDSGFRVALIATCLESLGTIPKEAITYNLLRDNLISSDYSLITKANDELKKKRKELAESDRNSVMPVSGSVSTDIQNLKSAPGVL